MYLLITNAKTKVKKVFKYITKKTKATYNSYRT